MPRRSKDERGSGAEDAPAERPAPPPAGLPDPKSVISEEEFTSPKGVRYRVLHTTETDPYDPPAPPAQKRDRGPKGHRRAGG